MSGHDHEEFPLAVVPVLPFGGAGLRDVHGDLTTGGSFQQFCEAAALVHIHLQRERNLLRWQIGKIGAVEFLLKAALWDLREQQCLRLVVEGLEQSNNLTQRHAVADRNAAICSIRPVGLTLHGIQNLVDQVINVDQLQFDCRI